MSKLKLRRKGGQAYKKYKDSGVECLPAGQAGLGDIPEGWEVRKLDKALNIIESGKREQINDTENRKVYSIGGEHINWDGSLKLDNSRFISENFYFQMNSGRIANQDVLLVKDGATIGKACFFEFNKDLQRAAVNEHVFILRPTKDLQNLYLYYLLISNFVQKQVLQQIKGSAQGGLNQSFAKNVVILLPSIRNQKIAISFLDKKNVLIDKYIKNLKKQILLFKEYRQKIISQAVTCGLTENGKLRKKPEWKEGEEIRKGWKDSGVEWLGLVPEGWEVRKLKYAVKKLDTKIDDSKEIKLRVLMENIESFTGQYVPTDDNELLSSKVNLFEEGSVLFGKLRPYLAKVYLAKSDGVCVSEFLTLQPKEITSEYLKNMLLNSDFIYLVNSSTYGAKMPRASWSFIGNVEVSYPNKKQQKAIFSYINYRDNQIMDEISEIEKQIELIKEYKQSLISKVVIGKVDVRRCFT